MYIPNKEFIDKLVQTQKLACADNWASCSQSWKMSCSRYLHSKVTVLKKIIFIPQITFLQVIFPQILRVECHSYCKMEAAEKSWCNVITVIMCLKMSENVSKKDILFIYHSKLSIEFRVDKMFGLVAFLRAPTLHNVLDIAFKIISKKIC